MCFSKKQPTFIVRVLVGSFVESNAFYRLACINSEYKQVQKQALTRVTITLHFRIFSLGWCSRYCKLSLKMSHHLQPSGKLILFFEILYTFEWTVLPFVVTKLINKKSISFPKDPKVLQLKLIAPQPRRTSVNLSLLWIPSQDECGRTKWPHRRHAHRPESAKLAASLDRRAFYWKLAAADSYLIAATSRLSAQG